MTEPPGPVYPWQAPVPAPGPAPGVEFAPHGQRLVAYLIDSVLLTLVVVVFWLPLFAIVPTPESAAPVDGGTVAAIIVFMCAGLLITLLYFPFFWATWGQTPGMRPFGLHVVRDQDGSRFGWKTALLRMVGMYVASAVFYLGFIWIFVDKRRRGFQDLIAGTVVVKRP
jgi:uncharacterized RDD family membrane protein YckC